MRAARGARTNWLFWRLLSALLLFCFAAQSFPQSGTSAQRASKPGSGVSLSVTIPAQSSAPPTSYLITIYPLKAPKPQTGHTTQTIKIDSIKKHFLGDRPFEVHAKSDSGLPVTLTVKKGPAKISGSVVTLLNEGTVEIEATQGGNAKYQPAKPKTVSFRVVDNHDYDYCVPGLLPPESWKNSSPPAKTSLAAAIIPLLGNPNPFSFATLGDKEILIYSSRYPLKPADTARLVKVKALIAKLLVAPGLSGHSAKASPSASTSSASASQDGPPAYSLETHVPHAGVLGDPASAISALNSSVFKVQDVGPNKILITSTSVPTCHAITQFLNDIRNLVWQPHPVSPVAQIFHLSAADVAKALNGADQPPAGAAPSSSATAPATASAPKTSDSAAGATPPTSSNGSSSATTTADAGKAASPAAMPKATPQSQVSSISPDLLLFPENAPGSDAAVEQQKRILALLDLPRPDVILNVWSMQESTTDREAVGRFNAILNEAVTNYNDGLQQAILRGWTYLSGQIQNNKDYFNKGFYDYVVKRYVAGRIDPKILSTQSPSQVASEVLDMRLSPKLKHREDHDICRADRYCLGYKTLFHPLQPTLTHLLLAILAAKHPGYQAGRAINSSEFWQTTDTPSNVYPSRSACYAVDKYQEQDYPHKHPSSSISPPLFLECFRQETEALLCQKPSAGGCSKNSEDTPFARQARAAIADFLFNYKMAQQYPRQFEPYELGLSAQNLNSVLSPFVDAFNRDVSVYQSLLRGEVQQQLEANYKKHRIFLKRWLGIDKQTFVNDGIITVRTLSTATATVNTTTQNFLDATQQPTVPALLSSIENASHPAASTTGHLTDLLQNISPIQAQVLVGALNAMQSSKVQLGKSLNVTVTPRSLNGASAAEINVTLNANDVASPTYYAPSQSSAASADVSRVATHDTTTTVRVDSLKLFDISAFSATLQRARPRFPLLPPFVELPYIGTLMGVPLPAVKEYHASSVVLSAVVVPTATDIAYGLTFVMDRVVDAYHTGDCDWPGPPKTYTDRHALSCSLRKADSLADLGGEPVIDFNKAMVTCLATVHTSGKSHDHRAPRSCNNMTFDSVFHGQP